MTVGQRGGFALGVVVGLLIGLSLALGVALYITKAPVPFVNKVPQRTAEQDQAEQARNRNWDPNAPLAGKSGKAAPAAGSVGPNPSEASASEPALATASPPAPAASAVAAAPGKPPRDPGAILAGAPTAAPSSAAGKGGDPFVYFVQAGAYSRADEAEQQRARLAMLGQIAKVTEREQNGRLVYRVRIGPLEARPEAETLQAKLQESSIEAQLVRVERP